MPTSFLSMFGGQFNHKEKLFLAFAWSPKVRCRRDALFVVGAPMSWWLDRGHTRMQLHVKAQAALSSAGQCPVSHSLSCLCAAAPQTYTSQLRCCRGTAQAMFAAIPQRCSQALFVAVLQATVHAARSYECCHLIPATLLLSD